MIIIKPSLIDIRQYLYSLRPNLLQFGHDSQQHKSIRMHQKYFHNFELSFDLEKAMKLE